MFNVFTLQSSLNMRYVVVKVLSRNFIMQILLYYVDKSKPSIKPQTDCIYVYISCAIYCAIQLCRQTDMVRYCV